MANIFNLLLYYYRKGRHDPVAKECSSEPIVTEQVRKMVAFIFQSSVSNAIRIIQNEPFGTLKPCCVKTFRAFHSNYEQVCLETITNVKAWQEERRYRISGSTCYNLYTYMSNKNPNWTMCFIFIIYLQSMNINYLFIFTYAIYKISMYFMK